MLDYRIDTFLVLCKYMNYRKTAEILHLSQPAVTQHIQAIERFYNCKLFNYENHKLSKTNAAILLEKYARAVKSHDYSLREKLEEKEINEIRIGVTKTIGDYYLEDKIIDFLNDKNNTLTVIVDNTEHLLKLLEDNELDFAVIEGMFDKDVFDNVLLRKEPFVGICHKNHPFASKEITIEELLKETIIHREKVQEQEQS